MSKKSEEIDDISKFVIFIKFYVRVGVMTYARVKEDKKVNGEYRTLG